MVIPLAILLFFIIVLAIVGFFFVFPYEAENYLFDFCEAACWNFDGVALNLELVSGKATIFTILILLSYKHRGSSHLLISLISFFSVLML